VLFVCSKAFRGSGWAAVGLGWVGSGRVSYLVGWIGLDR